MRAHVLFDGGPLQYDLLLFGWGKIIEKEPPALRSAIEIFGYCLP